MPKETYVPQAIEPMPTEGWDDAAPTPATENWADDVPPVPAAAPIPAPAVQAPAQPFPQSNEWGAVRYF